MFSRILDRKAWFDLEIAGRSVLHSGARRIRNAVRRYDGCIDLFLCVVDHFEPQVARPPRHLAMERLEDWIRRYPAIAGRHRDVDGRCPAHSFFYPWDEFDCDEFTLLAELCAAGWGEIELHLHHQGDTEESLREKISQAVRTYRSRGALSEWPSGQAAFSFIHGNWALNNSRMDGECDYCGVNDEITLLKREGCYADFTFPAWGHAAQPRIVNRIYWAESRPDSPKGHETGRIASVGRTGDPGMLLIQGPLVAFPSGNGLGRRIAIDDGDLAHYRRYRPERLDRWVRAGIGIEGRPDRAFIKLHCHGAYEPNRSALLDEDLDALFGDAEARYNDGRRYRLHYVTAREMYNVARGTIDGADGSAAGLRDYVLPPPGSRASSVPAEPSTSPAICGVSTGDRDALSVRPLRSDSAPTEGVD